MSWQFALVIVGLWLIITILQIPLALAIPVDTSRLASRWSRSWKVRICLQAIGVAYLLGAINYFLVNPGWTTFWVVLSAGIVLGGVMAHIWFMPKK